MNIILWSFVPLVILGVIIDSAWFKGVIGEFIVNISAKMFLDKKKYHLIKNVTLPTEDGSTQIDHIIVSMYGVFVVETKNMKGWIFGDPHHKIWTQKIYKHSSKFQNPLHQNYKHVKTLESLLGLEEHQIFSVVVFVGDSTFKTAMPENVTYGRGYIRFIKSKIHQVLTESEVSEISRKIESGRLTPSFKMNREHVKHVQKIIAEKEDSKTPSRPEWGIQINPVADIDSTKNNAIRKKQQRDPLFLLIARTLICIVAIDSFIWGYFAFVKKISLVEGLRGWTTGIQGFIGDNETRAPKIIKKAVVVNKYNQPLKGKVVTATINQRPARLPSRHLNTDDEIHDIEVKNMVVGDDNAIMYSWRDENGKINYSNTGFPEGNIEKLWVRRMPNG